MSERRTVVLRVATISGLVAVLATLAAGVFAANPGTATAAVTSGIPPLPAPVGFSGGGNVSCTGPGECTSTGDDGNWAVETHGSWVAQPSLSSAFPLAAGVSCIDAGDCTIVGDDSAGLAAYQTETAGTWGPVTEFPPAAQGSFSMVGNHSVSCTKPGNCTALGQLDGSIDPDPAAVTETDGTWGSPVPLGPGSTLFTAFEPEAVSCVSPGNCTVVGLYTYGPSSLDTEGFVATERGGVWTPYQLDPITGLLAPGSSIGFFTPRGISCSDLPDCTVVGDRLTARNTVAVYVSGSGGTWGSATDIAGSVPPEGGASTAWGQFNGVSCVDASDCIAVGQSGNGAPMFAIETGGTWGPATEAGDANQGGFDDVSCTSALYCTAVGLAGVGGFYSSTNTPSVVVTDNAARISAGGTLTFTATVTGTDTPAPTGSVTWTIPGTPCDLTTGPTASGNVSTYTCSITDASAGSYNAQADFEGDANYAQASGSDQATVSAQVGPASQTISFTAPASGTVGGSDTLSATGGASGNPVVFSVDASSGAGVCNVSGTNGTKVNYAVAGSCVIDANQDGNADYSAAAQVQRTISVLASQTIGFTAPASGTVGQSDTLSATGGGSGNQVVFSVDASSRAGVCNVSGTNGTKVNYTAAGSCVIDANQDGNANYSAAAQVQRTISVASGTLTLISSSRNPIQVGRSVTYTATVYLLGGGLASAGTVSFADFFTGTPISGCQSLVVVAGNASCKVSYSQTGGYTISATYSGTKGAYASGGGPYGEIVTPGPCATLAGCNLHGINLNGVWLGDLLDMSGANLSSANLTSAGLSGHDLKGANLRGANLTATVLEAANLSAANLNGANLTRAELNGAKTSGANFNGVVWSDTTCPDNTNSNDDGGTCVGHL